MVQHPEQVKAQMGAILHSTIMFLGSLLYRTFMVISKYIILLCIYAMSVVSAYYRLYYLYFKGFWLHQHVL